MIFFFSSRRRHTRFDCDWSSDVCSSDLGQLWGEGARLPAVPTGLRRQGGKTTTAIPQCPVEQGIDREGGALGIRDLITSRSNFLCSSCELSTRQGLQNQRGDQSVAEEDRKSTRLNSSHSQIS